ncbi:MAG: hypothetical protein H5T71_08225, partial [Chloroflexi bacterium]|nr:hypothetical protein [Chloroflexota bacterium]
MSHPFTTLLSGRAACSAIAQLLPFLRCPARREHGVPRQPHGCLAPHQLEQRQLAGGDKHLDDLVALVRQVPRGHPAGALRGLPDAPETARPGVFVALQVEVAPRLTRREAVRVPGEPGPEAAVRPGHKGRVPAVVDQPHPVSLPPGPGAARR